MEDIVLGEAYGLCGVGALLGVAIGFSIEFAVIVDTDAGGLKRGKEQERRGGE